MDFGTRPAQRDLEAQRIRNAAWARLAGTRAAPSRVGRYRIRAVAGSGGMGVVYRAYDPKLDREVAIKLIRPDATGLSAHERVARLRIEAKAAARVRDPHVVPIFDIGAAGSTVYVVMELVEGDNLADWLAAAPRPLLAILGVFEAAGRGLAAAHRVGVVHRDFKPGNVIVTPSGDVRVVDFGLARVDREPETATSPTRPAVATSDEALTQTGDLLGTPRYMAPEQRRGETVDARADQYAFCVALAEALRPLGPSVPGNITRAIARGRRQDRDARWPTMDALLSALRPRRRSRTIVWTGVLGLAAIGWIARPSADRVEECRLQTDAAARLSAPRRDEVRAALVARSGPAGHDAWVRIEPRLAGWVDAFEAATATACAPARNEAALACLQTRLRRVDTVLRELVAAETAVSREAIDVVARLPDPAGCLDDNESSVWPTDPQLRQVVAEARGQLQEANAVYDLGAHERCLEMATHVLEKARKLHFSPLVAEALDVTGSARLQLSEYDNARAELSESYDLAVAAGDDYIATRAAIGAAFASSELGELDEAETWLRHADTAVERRGGSIYGRRDIAARRAAVYLAARRFDDASEQFEIAIELTRQIDPTSPRLGFFELTRAGVDLMAGRATDIVGPMRDAVARMERDYGPDHPYVATATATLAGALADAGELDEAIEAGRRALAIEERLHGPDSLGVATGAHNLAVTYSLAGRFEELAALEARVLPILEHASARPRHTSKHLALQAMALAALGNIDGGIASARRAVTQGEASDDPVAIGSAHYALATALRAAGRYDEAVAATGRTLEQYESIRDPGAQTVLDTAAYHADTLARAGRGREAVELATDTLVRYERTGADAPRIEAQAAAALALGAHAEGDATGAERALQRALRALRATPDGPERDTVACLVGHAAVTVRGGEPPADVARWCSDWTFPNM